MSVPTFFYAGGGSGNNSAPATTAPQWPSTGPYANNTSGLPAVPTNMAPSSYGASMGFNSPPPTGGAYDNTGSTFAPGYNEFTNLPGVQDANNRANYFAQSLYAGTLANAPNFAQFGVNSNDIAAQIAYANGQYGVDKSYLTGSNANQLAELGLRGESLGVQQAAIPRNADYLNNLHSIAGQLFGVNNQRFDLQGQQAWQQADQSQRGLISRDVAAGSFGSVGYNQGLGDIQNQLVDTGKSIDLNRQTNALNQQQETAQWQNSLASNTDAGKQLDIQARGLGIDRNQLALDLQHGLDSLGLSNSVSLSSLFDKMQTNDIQQQLLAKQIWDAAIGASNYSMQAPQNGTSGAMPGGSVRGQ